MLDFRRSKSSRRAKIIGYSILTVAVPTMAVVLFLNTSFVYVMNISSSLPDNGYAMFQYPKLIRAERYVAFDPPEVLNRGHVFVKRITGLPGDVITVKSGQTCINEHCLPLTGEAPFFSENLAPQIIPDGKVFVEGDAYNSVDSRYAVLGLVDLDQIVATGFVFPGAPHWRRIEQWLAE